MSQAPAQSRETPAGLLARASIAIIKYLAIGAIVILAPLGAILIWLVCHVL